MRTFPRGAQDAYAYYLKKKTSIAERGLFEELPVTLRHKLISHKYAREILDIHLFRNMDRAFLSQLIVHSRPSKVYPGEVIYDCGDVSQEITFILRGSVRIIINNGYKDVLAGYSTCGGYFGDLEFFKKSVRTARYEAVQSCTFIAINFSHFTEAIKDHPVAGKKFMGVLAKRFESFQSIRAAASVVKKGPKRFDGSSLRRRLVKMTMRMSTVRRVGSKDKEMEKDRIGVVNEINGKYGVNGENNSTRADMDKRGMTNKHHVLNSDGSNMENSSPFAKNLKSSKSSTSARPMGGISGKLFSSFSRPLSSSSRGDLNGMRDARGRRKLSFSHSLLHPVGTIFASGPRLWKDGELELAQNDLNSEGLEADLSLDKVLREQRFKTLKLNSEGNTVTSEDTLESFRRLFLLHPMDDIKVNWDLFMGCWIVFSVLTVPLQLAFASYLNSPDGYSLNLVDYCIDGFFFADIVIAFNTVYYSAADEAYVAVRSRISHEYIRTWFFVDLISTVPFETFAALGSSASNNSNLTIVRLVKTVRLFRLLKLAKKVDMSKVLNQLEDRFHINPAVLSLIVTVLQVACISHAICCLWWGLCIVLTDTAWFDTVSCGHFSVPIAGVPVRQI